MFFSTAPVATKTSKLSFCFINNNSFKRYFKMKTIRNKDLHQCEKCLQYYKSDKSLQFHLKTQHLSHPKQYKCNRCESRYFTKCVLNRHKKMIHLNQVVGVNVKVCTFL